MAQQAQVSPEPAAPSARETPVPGPVGNPTLPAPAPGFFAGLFAPSRSNLLGDMGGLRPFLGNDGISLGLTETSEVLGNVTGGRRRGFDYDGLTEMSLGLDTQKAFGWEGGTFNISALQIHGRDLSTDNLLTLQTASSIEAERATRLWELWYQQSFRDGALDVKLGEQSLDQEFIVSQYAGTFINTMFGWPMLPSADLYGGGPAYPLSSLGVRVRAHPNDNITILAGVFDDNPGGGPFDADAQALDHSGTRLNLGTGALWIAELQYSTPALGGMSYLNRKPGLPGTYKVGFWYDSGRFPDQEFDTTGLSLANPASNGQPQLHRGNYSVYAVVDQLAWRPNATSPEGIGVFGRAMGTGDANRDLIVMSLNAGVTWKDPLPGRDTDVFGVGVGFTKVSSRAAALDKDIAFFTSNPAYPIRTNETFIELTYQYQVAPWWTLQPDSQYVFNPGGGILNPLAPVRKVGAEVVLGLRTTIVF